MKIRPLHDRVIVKRLEEERKTASGIVIPDAWREARKVVWPARKEAIQMTAYVFAFVVIMALFLWVTDKTVEWLFYDLILGWRK